MNKTIKIPIESSLEEVIKIARANGIKVDGKTTLTKNEEAKEEKRMLKKWEEMENKATSYNHINPYEHWCPQFNDESGWNLMSKSRFVYWYQHIDKKELRGLKLELKKTLYKITCIIENPSYWQGTTSPSHKNIYYVQGEHLQRFLGGFYNRLITTYDEQIVSIEVVDKIPNTNTRLSE